MSWKRTHTCGELRRQDDGQSVVLNGWVNRNRDHGGLTFIDVRDRYGITQVVTQAQNSQLQDFASGLRTEYVVSVRGKVRARPKDMINRELLTGEVEVVAESIQVLGSSETTPFPIDADQEPNEDLKFRYRYLELRRPKLQRSIVLRHKAVLAARGYLDAQRFLEIETPLLMKATPEGARDYVVPSRLYPGTFYALPQSPQIYKQLVMVSGFDRYFQIAKCLRDEDLRADRQPEFTQVDLEMSFVTQEDVFKITEGVLQVMCEAAEVAIPALPLERYTYDDAMDKYGSDKPDTRFELHLQDVTEVFSQTTFKAFQGVLAANGRVRAIRAPGGGQLSRKQIDLMTTTAQRAGAKGLAWFKWVENPDSTSAPVPTGGISKFLQPEEIRSLCEKFAAQPGDAFFLVADSAAVSAEALGFVRLQLAEMLQLQPKKGLHFLWVHRFPVFAPGETSTGWTPAHHMFTMPEPESRDLIESDPGAVYGQLYDLVCNGVELGSGSIRVHDPQLQRRIMRQVGLTDDEIEEKFGFMLNAFKYGAPPHGGIALGLDRLVMLLVGADNLRDVIAFPKTQRAASPLDGSPSPISAEQLEELGLSINVKEVVRKEDVREENSQDSV